MVAVPIVPANFPDRLLHLLQHERLAIMGNLGRVRLEHVAADPPKGGIP